MIKRLHPHVLRQATKPSTAGELKNMMVEVVQAGTGTAGADPGCRRRGQDRAPPRPAACNTVYDAWFIFFAPAENPTVAGAVVVEYQNNGFGGAIAAPIAKQLMQAILPPASNSTGTLGH